MIATWFDVAVAAPVAFIAGLLIGFVASNRWAIIRRNGRNHGD